MSALCLAAGATLVHLALSSFTLSWTHSVEKILWEEDWKVADGALLLTESRVRGSGAGMEPPEGAVLRGGSWHYRPDLPPLPDIKLARSGAVPDWRLCVGDACRPLGQIARLPPASPPVTLYACGKP
jgi:hypothetical protein